MTPANVEDKVRNADQDALEEIDQMSFLCKSKNMKERNATGKSILPFSITEVRLHAAAWQKNVIQKSSRWH